jgi:hypothetical protein
MAGRGARVQIPGIEQIGSDGRLPEVVVYQNSDFGGEEYRTNLNVLYFPQDSFWNDCISSIIVVSGVWEFCVDSYYKGRSSKLTPGYYRNPDAFHLPNDSISSFRVVGLKS